MKSFISFWLILILTPFALFSQDLGENYIMEWKKFYPSKAVDSGIRSSVFNYEERSKETIESWLDFNEEILSNLSAVNPAIDLIDGRLLRVKAQSEVDKWKTLTEHETSLRLYSQLISKAITPIFKADYLLGSEKAVVLCDRLKSITSLAKAAQANLKQVSQNDLEKGLEDLNKTHRYLQTDIANEMHSNGILKTCDSFNLHISEALQGISDLKRLCRSYASKKYK